MPEKVEAFFAGDFQQVSTIGAFLELFSEVHELFMCDETLNISNFLWTSDAQTLAFLERLYKP